MCMFRDNSTRRINFSVCDSGSNHEILSLIAPLYFAFDFNKWKWIQLWTSKWDKIVVGLAQQYDNSRLRVCEFCGLFLVKYRLIPPLLFGINTLRPRQNGVQCPDDNFNCIFVNKNIQISIKISLNFVPRYPINNIPTLVQIIMAWRQAVIWTNGSWFSDAYIRHSVSLWEWIWSRWILLAKWPWVVPYCVNIGHHWRRQATRHYSQQPWFAIAEILW